MGSVVDEVSRRTIVAYLKYRGKDKEASKAYPYGYGTTGEVVNSIFGWCDETGHKLYKHNSLTHSAMAQRLSNYVNGNRVNSSSLDDARWIAVQMRERMKVVAPVEAVVEPTPDNGQPKTFKELVELAHLLRGYAIKAEDEHDTELWAITAGAEVKVLRLTLDRLEQ